MDRRTCISCIAGASLAADAQTPGKVYRVGWLSVGIPTPSGAYVDTLNGFKEELHQ